MISEPINVESRSFEPSPASVYSNRLKELTNDLLQLDQPGELHKAATFLYSLYWDIVGEDADNGIDEQETVPDFDRVEGGTRIEFKYSIGRQPGFKYRRLDSPRGLPPSVRWRASLRGI